MYCGDFALLVERRIRSSVARHMLNLQQGLLPYPASLVKGFEVAAVVNNSKLGDNSDVDGPMV